MCPFECINSGCVTPDFLERHGSWVLTVIVGVTGCLGMVLTYFLKSRCSRIYCCCGVKCFRDVIELGPSAIEIRPSSSKV